MKKKTKEKMSGTWAGETKLNCDLALWGMTSNLNSRAKQNFVETIFSLYKWKNHAVSYSAESSITTPLY